MAIESRLSLCIAIKVGEMGETAEPKLFFPNCASFKTSVKEPKGKAEPA